jgi:hypothetical protein
MLGQSVFKNFINWVFYNNAKKRYFTYHCAGQQQEQKGVVSSLCIKLTLLAFSLAAHFLQRQHLQKKCFELEMFNMS